MIAILSPSCTASPACIAILCTRPDRGAEAVAISGDDCQFVEVRGRRRSHTIDPLRGAPLLESPVVIGSQEGSALARKVGIDALFLHRGEDAKVRTPRVGRTFEQTLGGYEKDGAFDG